VEAYTAHMLVGLYTLMLESDSLSPDLEVHRSRSLPVISVAPVCQPQLKMNMYYALDEDRTMMYHKIRTILRIAAVNCHQDLCVGSFGIGFSWQNPPKDVAEMWRTVLFHELEFEGLFRTVIFAFPERNNDMMIFEETLRAGSCLSTRCPRDDSWNYLVIKIESRVVSNQTTVNMIHEWLCG
jgi:hypothetical protein